MRRRRFATSALGVGGLLLLTACVGPAIRDARTAEGAPEPAGSVVFTASGDIGTTAEAEATLGQIREVDSDVHFALGDLSYGDPGEEQDWCDFVTEQVGTDFPFQLLSGNHESDGLDGDIDVFAECLPDRLDGLVGDYAKQYYVDVPADDPLGRFVMISPGITYPDGTWSYDDGSERSDWTRAAIQDAHDSGIPWIIVGMHKPCLSVGNYECDPGPEVIDLVVASGADLVIGGHEHIYQRSAQLGLGDRCASLAPDVITAACVADDGDELARDAGTVFVTVGTGGTPLREVHRGDSEAGYFAAWSGANSEPSWGNLRVVLSESVLEAEFVPAVGTFVEGFVSTLREWIQWPMASSSSPTGPLSRCASTAS